MDVNNVLVVPGLVGDKAVGILAARCQPEDVQERQESQKLHGSKEASLRYSKSIQV